MTLTPVQPLKDDWCAPASGGGVEWLDVANPTLAELEALAQVQGLHSLSVEDALTDEQAPKVEAFGAYLFLVLRTARLVGEEIVYGQIAVFARSGQVITVRRGADEVFQEARRRWDALPPEFMPQAASTVLHTLMDTTVDAYVHLVEKVEDAVLAIEGSVLDSGLSREQVAVLFKLRRELILFLRVVTPSCHLAQRLLDTGAPFVPAEVRPYFRDVADHLERVKDSVNGLWEVVTSVFEVSNLLEQQRQNAITRQLAAWGAIIAVPTAIAGIYGMNFDHMPELHYRYSYFVVLGVIALICWVLHRSFRRAGWL
ncbi:magnesium and cobalt transport protein CorA [Ottowia flava]|uniref:Magnesium and cobalt transport protein CorA n=1 Tax=Ottowia flava TaxID=2675430 RepID=A0ABW4KSV4_9BURK|nr:magnesium and cobalt transport protein CorA [Ottowia sp. GY511]